MTRSFLLATLVSIIAHRRSNMEFRPKTVKELTEYDLFESVHTVWLKNLKEGDQIAVKGEFGQLSPALHNFQFPDGVKHYFHHGIYIGDKGGVIHLSGQLGNVKPNKVDLLKFMEGSCDRKLYRVRYKESVCLPVEETIQMAEDFIEDPSCWKRSFDILYYNCETFATYLKTKIESSSQAQKALRQLPSYQKAILGSFSVASTSLGSGSFGSGPSYGSGNGNSCCGSGNGSSCCCSGNGNSCCGSGNGSSCCG